MFHPEFVAYVMCVTTIITENALRTRHYDDWHCKNKRFPDAWMNEWDTT